MRVPGGMRPRRPAVRARRGGNRRTRPRGRSGLSRLALALGVPLGATAVFLAARAVVEGDVFRVREITFRGLVHARPSVLVAEGGLTRRRSVFDDVDAVEARLLRDPLVRRARVRRALPGRLVVEIVEREPVAYWSEGELWPLDAEGRVLPLAATHHGWDLPILMADDGRPALHEGRLVDAEARGLLRLVLGVGDRVPEVARRVSVAELREEGRVVLHLMEGAAAAGEVRLRLETPLSKLALLPDVLRDLEGKRLNFDRLDLSYEDQIVVRPVPLSEAGAPRAPAEPDTAPAPRAEPEPGAAEGAGVQAAAALIEET